MWIVGFTESIELSHCSLRYHNSDLKKVTSGNLLGIGVATYTDGPCYNLLFSERLRLGFYAAKTILRLARAFAATRRIIADIWEFYTAALPAPGSIAHLFPSPLPIPTYIDSVSSLTFTRRLSRSGETIILAEDETTRQSSVYLTSMARPGPDLTSLTRKQRRPRLWTHSLTYAR
jgi:hypothetical protein